MASGSTGGARLPKVFKILAELLIVTSETALLDCKRAEPWRWVTARRVFRPSHTTPRSIPWLFARPLGFSGGSVAKT